MKEEHTALLKAVGTGLLFIAIIISAHNAYLAADAAEALPESIHKIDVSKPFEELSNKEKEKRGYDIAVNRLLEVSNKLDAKLNRESFISNLTNKLSVAWMTYLGGFMLVLAETGAYWRSRTKE
jgi:ABC-type maltose transport system permease subunit